MRPGVTHTDAVILDMQGINMRSGGDTVTLQPVKVMLSEFPPMDGEYALEEV